MNTLTINNIDNAAYVWDRLAWDSSIRTELVRELSTNEIDEVNGGIWPLVAAIIGIDIALQGYLVYVPHVLAQEQKYSICLR